MNDKDLVQIQRELAKRLGLKTIWVNRRADRAKGGGATPAAAPVTPDGEVPTLAALADLHCQQRSL